MNDPGCVHDQKASRIRPDVLEGVHLTPGDLDEIARLADAGLGPDAELKCTIKHIERFVICWMAVGRWSCSRAHQSFNEAVSCVRITNEETQQNSRDVEGISLCVGHGPRSPGV